MVCPVLQVVFQLTIELNGEMIYFHNKVIASKIIVQ